MKIGITGGIGSGKTTICKKLQDIGYYVFYSDFEAKVIANNDYILKNKITNIFGYNAYIDNVYNSEYIRNIVFDDKLKLDALNNCFSNIIIQKYLNESKNYDITFFESALIFEHKLEIYFDVIIGIYCEYDEVVKRLGKRNNFNLLEIDKIQKNQLNVDDKMNRCDLTIDTTNGISDILIERMINQILNYGK